MCIGKPVSTVTRQRVLIFRRSVLAIEPSLIPILWVIVKFGVRKNNILPFLNGDATEFSIGPVYDSVRRFKWKKSLNNSTVGSS